MQSRAFIFDLGQVIFGFQWQTALAALQGRVQISSDQVYELIATHPDHLEFELGRISCSAFFGRWVQELGFDGSAQDLEDIWNSIFNTIPANLQILKSLTKVAAVKTAFLSNTNPAHIACLKAEYDIFNLTDYNCFSYQIGLRKPDPRIYLHCCQQLGLHPNQAIFIDDLIENVEAARALGIEGIHYTGQDLSQIESIARYL